MSLVKFKVPQTKTFIERLKENMQFIRGIYDPSYLYWKTPTTSMGEYYKSGVFQESILPYKKGDKPVNGDLRIKDNQVMQYHSDNGKYKILMQLYQKGEKPKDQEIRLRGNQVMQYYADKDKYKILQTFPEHFIGPGRPTKPTPFTDFPGYIKEVGKNFPKSVGNLMKFFGAVGQMASPMGIGEELSSKITGMPTSWELANFPKSWTFAQPHQTPQGQPLGPASIVFPYTQKGTEMGGAYGATIGLTKDVENLATMPLKMVWQLRQPFKFLREDPAGFMMAGMMLRGGMKAGTDILAKQTTRSYIDSNLFRDYITDIPMETFVKFGIDRNKLLNAVDKIPKNTRIPLNAFERGSVSNRGTIKQTIEEVKRLHELQTGEKLPEPSATPEFRTGDVLYRGEHEYRITNIMEPEKGSGAFEYEIENVRSGEAMPGLGEKQVGEMFTKQPGKALTGDEYANELAKDTIGKDIDFGVGLGNVVSRAVDDLTMMLNQTQAGRSVINKIAQRGRFLRSKELKSSLLLQDITKDLTPQEMQSMTFFRQGITDFNALRNAGYEKVIPDLVNPSSKLIEATNKMGEVFDRDFQYLQKYYDDILFLEHYVPNMWDISKGQMAQLRNHYKTFNPFVNKRKIPTLEEGLKRGYKLKVDSIKDIYRIYDKYKNEVVANTELANALFNMKDEGGRPLITRKKLADNLDYEPVEHPVFGFKSKKAFVHPDIYKELKIIWERTDPGKVALAYDRVNAFLKFANLSFTLFHHGALSESGLGAIGPLKTTSTFFRSMYDALRGKTPKILTDEMRPLTRHATKHGVVLKPSPDVRLNIIENTLRDIESKAPENVTWIPKVLHKGFEVWNKALWDNFHNTLKVMSFEEFTARQIPKTKKAFQKKFGIEMNAKNLDAIKNELGDFTNYSFGSLAWEKEGLGKFMMGNPKMQRALHRILLSPDWTLSVLKQASSLARGPWKMKVGEQLLKEGKLSEGQRVWAEGHALKGTASRYWRRMLAYSFTILQSVNLAVSQKMYGKPRFTWENAPGHEYHVLIGKGKAGQNIEGEKEIYLRFGKQITEVMRWPTKPIVQLGSKTAPLASVILRQFTKHDPGTGWPTEFAGEGRDTFWNRFKDMGQALVPFSLKNFLIGEGSGQFMLMYPLSQGMSDYKAIRFYKKALKIQDESDRTNRMNRITMACLENGVDWKKNLKEAQSAVRMQPAYDQDSYLNQFRNELRKAPNIETRVDLLNAYRERGSLTPLQLRRLAQEQEEKDRVVRQLKNKEQESVFIKRIAGQNYQDGLNVKNQIADDYNTINYQAIMLIRDKKIPQAIKMVREWNVGLKERLDVLAQTMQVKPSKLYGSPLHKNYLISEQNIMSLAKQALLQEQTTAFERQIRK